MKIYIFFFEKKKKIHQNYHQALPVRLQSQLRNLSNNTNNTTDENNEATRPSSPTSDTTLTSNEQTSRSSSANSRSTSRNGQSRSTGNANNRPSVQGGRGIPASVLGIFEHYILIFKSDDLMKLRKKFFYVGTLLNFNLPSSVEVSMELSPQNLMDSSNSSGTNNGSENDQTQNGNNANGKILTKFGLAFVIFFFFF